VTCKVFFHYTISLVGNKVSFIRNSVSIIQNTISFYRQNISFIRNITSLNRNIISFYRNTIWFFLYIFPSFLTKGTILNTIRWWRPSCISDCHQNQTFYNLIITHFQYHSNLWSGFEEIYVNIFLNVQYFTKKRNKQNGCCMWPDGLCSSIFRVRSVVVFLAHLKTKKWSSICGT
jgi:hypothetical protein